MPHGLFTYDPIIFRVDGEPLPFPKKEIGVHKKRQGAEIVTRAVMIDRDVKRHKDPVTGELVVVSRGDKARWVNLVRDTAAQYMRDYGLKPFPQNHPIAMGCLFFVTKAKSCELEFPSIAPDLDNLEYSIWNALKHTPKVRRHGQQFPGRYLSGICFYDDCQIVWRLHPSGVLWADKDNPPGVIVMIKDAEPLAEELAAAAKAFSATLSPANWGTAFESIGRNA